MWWFRAGQVAALAALAVLGLVDVALGLFDTPSDGPDPIVLVLPEFLSPILIAAVLLTSHRLGRHLLPALACLVAGFSLATTAVPLLLKVQVPVFFGFAEASALLGLLIVVTRKSSLWLGLLGGGALAWAVITQPMRGGLGDATIILGLILALIAAGAVAAGAYLRVLEHSRTRQVATVRAEQRAEFARDLHDFIAHHVTGIVVQAQGARMIAAQDPQRVVTALEQIERAGAETMASMRRMVGVLREMDDSPDAPLAPLAGVAELRPLVEEFCASGPPHAYLRQEGDVEGLPVEVTSSAYRVVMEALTNVRRHAVGASKVDIFIRRTPDWLLVRVADDGRGARGGLPREGRRDGFGLMGLTERVRSLGGRIQAGPGIDGGWVVDAGLPLVPPNGGPAGRIAG
jgi:signal transduction histidine kinase